MRLNTCSGVISFAKELENKTANFYQDLAQKYDQDAEILLSFANENHKNIIAIERAYYEVITDAIESCFAFNVDTDKYDLKTELGDNTSYSDALSQAIEIEEKIIKFYSDTAAQSEGLMADVPRAFQLVAKKRGGRRSRLESLG